MENINTFLGHDTNYWLALQKRAMELDVVKLIEEISQLYSKVGFYERRIKELADFKERKS